MRCALPLILVLAGCVTTSTVIPREWTSLPSAPRIRAVTLDAEGKVAPAGILPLKPGPIRIEAGRVMNGEKALTESFAAIDSFDFSESRGEVVFSAKRD